MALTPEQVEILNQPFAIRDYEEKQGFIYVTEYAICRRLTLVDPSWEMNVVEVKRFENSLTTPKTVGVVATVRLTVCGVTRENTGMHIVEYSKSKVDPNNKSEPRTYFAEMGEAEKAAVTDAFKRTARLLGPGQHILLAKQYKQETGKDPATNIAHLEDFLNWVKKKNEENEQAQTTLKMKLLKSINDVARAYDINPLDAGNKEGFLLATFGPSKMYESNERYNEYLKNAISWIIGASNDK